MGLWFWNSNQILNNITWQFPLVSLSPVQSKRFFWIYCFREKIFGQKTAEEMLLLAFKLNSSGPLSNVWGEANNRLEKNMMSFCPKVLEENNVPLIRGRESRAVREQEVTCEGWASSPPPRGVCAGADPKRWVGSGGWGNLGIPSWLTPLEFSRDVQVLGNS